jgi:hypothetical protein
MIAAARAAALLAIALLLPACNLFFTTDIPVDPSPAPQNPFALQIPLNNANGVVPTNTQFAWGPMPAAISYELQISLASDFSQIVHTQSGITITQVFSSAILTNSTIYYWRITGFDNSSNRLAAGSPYKFTTAPSLSAPGQFFLVAPSGGNVSRTPDFSWTNSTQAAVYSLQVDTLASFSAPVVDLSNLHVTQATCPITLLPLTTYYWQVTSSNSLGLWSTPTASFVTGP